MCRAGLRKNMPQSLFRRRLADRAGDRDDPRRCTRSRCDSEAFHRPQDIVDHIKRTRAF